MVQPARSPAILIAAPASGQGKTTVTAALARLPQVKRIMPVNGAEAGVRFGNADHLSYVGGNDTNFPQIFNWPVIQGSYFTQADEDSAAAVAVIGIVAMVWYRNYKKANPDVSEQPLLNQRGLQYVGQVLLLVEAIDHGIAQRLRHAHQPRHRSRSHPVGARFATPATARSPTSPPPCRHAPTPTCAN